jgi:hypothetical protein
VNNYGIMSRLLQPEKRREFLQSSTMLRWLRWGIVAGVLLISMMLALLDSLNHLQLVLIGVVGILGVFTLIQWPALGLLAILFGTYFVGYTGPGGVNAVILGVVGVAALWFADMVIRQRNIHFVHPRTTTAILFFSISAVLSLIVGQLPWQPLASHAPVTAQLGGLTITLTSALAFLIMGNVIRDIRWLKAFAWLFLAIGMLYMLARLSPSAARFLRHVFVPGAYTGSLVWVWIVAIPLSQALLNKKLPLLVRIAFLGFVAIVLYIAIGQASDWKSGYIPPLAGAAVILLLAYRKYFLWFLPILLVGAWFVMEEAISSDQYSVLTRLEAWQIVLQLSIVSPLFGMGFSNYYFYTPLHDIRGWRVNFSSHSQYVDIVAQTGLIGLACFFWIFWEIARLGWSLIDRAPEGFERAYVYGAMGGLAGTLVAGLFVDWILPFVYNIGMNGIRSSILSWFFLGGLVAIYQIMKQQPLSSISRLEIGGNNA